MPRPPLLLRTTHDYEIFGEARGVWNIQDKDTNIYNSHSTSTSSYNWLQGSQYSLSVLFTPFKNINTTNWSFLVGPKYSSQKVTTLTTILNLFEDRLTTSLSSNLLGGEAGFKYQTTSYLGIYFTGSYQYDVSGQLRHSLNSAPQDFSTPLKSHYEWSFNPHLMFNPVSFLGLGLGLNTGAGSYRYDGGTWNPNSQYFRQAIQSQTLNYTAYGINIMVAAYL